ncbi:4-hydroxybenzoate polyprenyltransferase, mitochondrial [Grifola frondosa]|uniref:4-hydroxybenzoate polyprenyltransferase, mitochondrial n=1 Tax=Grifola frondosa TaxID=5627 RepID=A0A1C7MMZ2_GRIFR|nr:4-hydroxybenzoate polyprenyltransferase, mitochondrial [Grifola frondosa]
MDESTPKQDSSLLHKLEKSAAQDAIPPLWLSYVKLTRVHKFPAGSILVFWPSAWGLALSAYSVGLPARILAIQLIAHLVGSVLRHNAACIWNDMCDCEVDKLVNRTKGRPIARGLVSMTGASILLSIHYVLCVLLLSYAGNFAMKVGLVGLFFIDVMYPLTKRWTNWPQAWLGVAMTWGLPVAWISVNGVMDWPLISTLFLGGICWTIHYDTIYACQDLRDDIKAGVRSTAVLFGSALTTLDFDVGSECWAMFKANGDLGFVILGGMLGDYALRVLL